MTVALNASEASAGHVASGRLRPTPLSRVDDAGCRAALEQMGESRRLLARSLAPAEAGTDGASPAGGRTGASFTDLLGVGMRHWVSDKPWYAQARAIGEVSKMTVIPWIRRNPGTSLAIAATAGAIVVAAKPWRWSWLGHHWRGVPTMASGWIMRELSNPVTQGALLTSLVALVTKWAEGESQATAPVREEGPGEAPGQGQGPVVEPPVPDDKQRTSDHGT